VLTGHTTAFISALSERDGVPRNRRKANDSCRTLVERWWEHCATSSARNRKDAALQAYLLVFLGGGIGAALRHCVNIVLTRLVGTSFPYNTLFANVSGSLLMGLLTAYFSWRTGSPQSLRLFLTTGILGGYTTFSTFSLDSVLLWERSQYLAAAGYVFASVGASLIGVLFGAILVRVLN
jgi:fluoride exporter